VWQLPVTTQTIIQRKHFPLLGPYVAPSSPTQQQLAEIWRRAFAMDSIGIHDRYLDLGGDSLLAASIFADCEQVFGLKLPWALLAEAGTVEEMATAIDRLRSVAD
jgi:acyl carrier protein